MTLKQESIEIEVILDFKMYCEKELISNNVKNKFARFIQECIYTIDFKFLRRYLLIDDIER